MSSREVLYIQPSLFEPLEDRIAPATLVVNSVSDGNADDDFLTLREAISLANASPGKDLIAFDKELFHAEDDHAHRRVKSTSPSAEHRRTRRGSRDDKALPPTPVSSKSRTRRA